MTNDTMTVDRNDTSTGARPSGDAPDAAIDTTSDRYRLFFDADCPFCKLEVDWLLRRRGADFEAVDIASPSFDPGRYGLTDADLHGQLHGMEADGTVTVGMDSVRASYRAAGVGWMMAWTAWPILRPLSDLGYRIFARYRVPLGRLFGRSCEDGGSCQIPRT